MWTQSEDAYQTTHDGNSTTIASKTIKRCDAFDEEEGENFLIFPLIKEVGKYFYVFLLILIAKFRPIEFTISRLFLYHSNCITKDSHLLNAIRRKSQ